MIAGALGSDAVSILQYAPKTRYDSPVVDLSDYERRLIMRVRAMSDEQRDYLETVAIREYTVATSNDITRNKSLLEKTKKKIAIKGAKEIGLL